MTHPNVRIEKIGITDIYRVKYSARSYYLTIPKKVVDQYALVPGHFLKIQIKEVRKPFEEEVIE